jgi:predicted neuraminidase
VSPSNGAARNSIPCVAATPGGKLLATWAVPTGESTNKLKIVYSLSQDQGRTWKTPATLIDNPGKEDADPNIIIDGRRIVVLSTTLPVPGKIITTEFWMTESSDDGLTWSKPVQASHSHKYAEGKVHVGHKLRDGRLAIGYAWEIFCEKGLSPATEGEMDNRSGLLLSSDGGRSWKAGGDMYAQPQKLSPHSVNGVDEPATVVLDNGDIFALLRTGSDHLFESRSMDNGATWETPKPSPLTGHNAPAALWRLRGTNDVVVVWDNSPEKRWPLSVTLSRDGCKTWLKPKILSPANDRQASYPSVTQTSDLTIFAVWQEDRQDKTGRDIHWARFNMEWLLH